MLHPQAVTTDPELAARLAAFAPLSLAELNRKAALMNRRDNKYVLDTSALFRLLAAAAASFDVLEIDGRRQFSYFSQYFDSPAFHTCADHNQGRRRRFKMRHRHYVDSDLHYFEIKLKGLRKMTQKYRTVVVPDELLADGALHPRLQAFCRSVMEEHGYPVWEHPVLPSLAVFYRRITLIGRAGDVRVTLDNRIAYAERSTGPWQPLNDERWVVEVKSAHGRTATDRWLLRQRYRPVAQCSKYCLGVRLLEQVGGGKRFGTVLRRHFMPTADVVSGLAS